MQYLYMESATIQRAAFYVPKGGVGKTTSCAHVAVSADQHHDKRVLLIDLAGRQNDLATQFGMRDELDAIDAPVSAIFGDDWEFIKNNVDDVIGRMTFETPEGPDLIPADGGIGAKDNSLANVNNDERYDKLVEFVDEFVAPEYDLVLFDLPGKEDNISLNGLFAAQDVVVPLCPGEFEYNQLKSLDADLERLRDDHGDTYDTLPYLRTVIPTQISQATNLSASFVADVRDEYPDISTTTVAATADVGSGQSDGHTLFDFDDDELLATGKRARDAYREVTAELLDTLEAR